MVGLLIGQGLIFGSLPIVTRIYSTEEIGYSGAFLAAASIVGAIATFRLETLLPSATDAEASWLARSALKVLMVMSTLACIGYFVMRHQDGWNAIYFGLTVIGLGTVTLSLQYASRARRLNGVAVSKASQGIGQVATQVIAGFAGATRVGMQAGFAAGYLVSGFVQWFALQHKSEKVRPGEISSARKLHFLRQSFILTIAGGLNIIAVWMYPLVIQHFFGSFATGLLTVSQRLVIVPAGLMVAAFAPVVVSAVSATIRAQGQTRPQILRLVRRFAPLGILTVIVMLSIPQDWLVILFGKDYGATKGYLAALALTAGSQVIVGPLGLVLILQNRSKTQLLWDLSRTMTLVTVTAGTALLSNSPLATIWAGSLTMTFFHLVYLWLILHPTMPKRPAHSRAC